MIYPKDSVGNPRINFFNIVAKSWTTIEAQLVLQKHLKLNVIPDTESLIIYQNIAFTFVYKHHISFQNIIIEKRKIRIRNKEHEGD